MRIGIIGAGVMGSTHAESYQFIPDAELVAIWGMEKEQTQRLARRFGAKACETAEEIIDDPEIEVVDICVPTPFHKEYVLNAASTSKNIICEKPLARNLDDGKEIIQACKSAGVKLMVGHVVRFFPEYQLAKKIIDEGRIGKPGIARTSRAGSFPYGYQDWYADPQKSGGPILDLIIHDFDYLRWCFGEVERVYAKSLTPRGLDHLDYALVTLRFKNGMMAHVEGSWAYPPGTFFTRLEVSGDGGLLEYDSRKVCPLRIAVKQEGEKKLSVTLPESPLEESPYTAELRHFIKYFKGEVDPMLTPEDALKALEIACAALESVRTEEPVSIG